MPNLNFDVAGRVVAEPDKDDDFSITVSSLCSRRSFTFEISRSGSDTWEVDFEIDDAQAAILADFIKSMIANRTSETPGADNQEN